MTDKQKVKTLLSVLEKLSKKQSTEVVKTTPLVIEKSDGSINELGVSEKRDSSNLQDGETNDTSNASTVTSLSNILELKVSGGKGREPSTVREVCSTNIDDEPGKAATQQDWEGNIFNSKKLTNSGGKGREPQDCEGHSSHLQSNEDKQTTEKEICSSDIQQLREDSQRVNEVSNCGEECETLSVAAELSTQEENLLNLEKKEITYDTNNEDQNSRDRGY